MFGIKRNTLGISRTVFLTKRYAFKVPCCRYGWSKFLAGLLCNIQERAFGTCYLDGVCPVLFSDRFGFLVVMPRCDELDFEPSDEQYKSWINREDYVIPAEPKYDSWGLLNGKIVAVDYGS